MSTRDVALEPLDDRFAWTRLRPVLIGAYLVVYVWWFFAFGLIIDRISVLISIAVFLVIGSVGPVES